jgi:hypothetical protein
VFSLPHNSTNDTSCSSATPCGMCEGDCDSDNDCAEGLVCG